MVKIGVMRDHTNFLPDLYGIFFNVKTIYRDLSVGRADKRCQYLNERGFSCSIWSEYCEEFTFFYLKIDISKDNICTERF
jgi:hypothetical protein